MKRIDTQEKLEEFLESYRGWCNNRGTGDVIIYNDYIFVGVEFYNTKFYNTEFNETKFNNTKFYNTEFNETKFYNTEFYKTEFNNTKFNDTDIPKIDNINTYVLSLISQKGCKLEMGLWHTCDTSHCIAGWIGTQYPELEKKYGTETFGYMVYINSSSLPIPNFHEMDDEKALNNLKELASLENVV
jgi:hypothetical protein